jgi:hypothetical protein
MVLLTVQALAFISAPASAQELVYVINSESVDVYISHDGSADINYLIHLTVRPQSAYVSSLTIHLPNWRFDIGQTTVTLDGNSVMDLKKAGTSSYPSTRPSCYNPGPLTPYRSL